MQAEAAQETGHEHQEHQESHEHHDPVMDHDGMDHDAMDHDGMDHDGMDHDAMDHARTQGPDIKPITAADWEAAFPDLSGHEMKEHMDDDSIHSFVLADRAEAQFHDSTTSMVWDAKAWLGRDFNRLWLRSEGERTSGETREAHLEALWGRPVARWWDLVGGVRHDFAPGSSQTWLAFGVIGVAPYMFEVEATAYVGEQGRTAVRVEAEYDMLFTNRLILQPRAEFLAYGKDDAQRLVGSGLSHVEIGARLRYEIRREFAPYIGVEWGRSLGDTADFLREAGEDVRETRFVVGVRAWF